ncbi:MAG: hypothetical protein A3C06_01070 [Candidatus Taylorbacteria bacterium RIFCSPHIGHO2_02_FULL_46_13]|uniref:Uncharacterized protein n=1 Tax=Candidatus Taylorbacteria bacterium RIFCSPHIGHO2_02_FULL_46_13 TaxID=1802312 RepID=A0A1G2MT94_9BACT|nr:MAG: hypothetical protein A3C06_01070 [Candidatus Taylorbacteria bacterium RIFCSPHIGHO2_02_FULL_46_13]
MQERNTRWTVVGIIVIIAVAGIYLMYGSSSQPLDSSGQSATSTDFVANKPPTRPVVENSNADTGVSTIISSETFTLRNNIQYTLETFNVRDAAGTIVGADQRLVSSVAGKRVMVISNIKQAVPDLGKMILKKFTVRQDPELIVFVSVSANADASYGALYEFDFPTKKFSKMAASRFLPFVLSVEENPTLFSPDRTKFLSIIDRTFASQKETKYLYVVDLATDQARSIADVGTSESFTQTIGAGDFPVGFYQWGPPTTITYSVFDSNSPLDLSGKSSRVPVQVRVLQLNPDQK